VIVNYVAISPIDLTQICRIHVIPRECRRFASRDQRRLCSGRLRHGGSGLLTLLMYLTRNRQLLTKGLKGPPFAYSGVQNLSPLYIHSPTLGFFGTPKISALGVLAIYGDIQADKDDVRTLYGCLEEASRSRRVGRRSGTVPLSVYRTHFERG
jgi:hypothetical protein